MAGYYHQTGGVPISARGMSLPPGMRFNPFFNPEVNKAAPASRASRPSPYGLAYQRAIPGIDAESWAQEAGTAVGGQYDTSRGIADRNLSRMGINPASGRYAGTMDQWARARAAAVAGAMTGARRQAQKFNVGHRMQVAGLALQGRTAGQAAAARANALNLQRRQYRGQLAGEKAEAEGLVDPRPILERLFGQQQTQQGLGGYAPAVVTGGGTSPVPSPSHYASLIAQASRQVPAQQFYGEPNRPL